MRQPHGFERQHREDDILTMLDESASTLLRSQSAPAAGAALSATLHSHQICVVPLARFAVESVGGANFRAAGGVATVLVRDIWTCW